MNKPVGSTAVFQPIVQFPAAERRRIRAVLTDIDDTLTRDGAIEPVGVRRGAAR